MLVAIAAIACGKKGPPLPPLVRLPSAPADFAAELRGATVDLQFTVPAANTDNSRPANVQRVDVYAITTGETLTDAQILKLGTRVASVDVKAPRDPDSAIEEDEPPSDMGPEGAVNILYKRELEAASDPAAARADKVREFREKFANPYIAAGRGFLDEVIHPRETRRKLTTALRNLEGKRVRNPAKKHGNIPL